MKDFIKRCLILLCLSISIHVYAQDFTIETGIKNSDYTPITDGSKKHNVEGSTIIVTITVDPGSLQGFEPQSTKVRFHGEEKSVNFDKNQGMCEFETKNIEGEYQVECEDIQYNYTTQDEDGTQTKKSSQINGKKSNEIYVTYAKPQYTNGDIIKKNVSTNDTILSSLSGSGGNPDGWKYKWDNEESNDSTCKSNKPSEKGWKSTTLEVINYAPDGKTVWYKSPLYTYQTYFYNEPTNVGLYIGDVKLTDSNNSFYKTTGEWEVMYDGGGDYTEYSWNEGSASPNPTNTPVPSTTTDKEEQNLTVIVSFYSDATNRIFLKEDTITYTYNVYKEISWTPTNTKKSGYEGDKLNFKPGTPSGGYPNGWKYKLLDNNNNETTLESSDFNTPQGTLKAGENVSNYTYTLIAENYYKDEKWDEKQITFSADFYNLPSYTVTGKVNVTLHDGKTNTDNLTYISGKSNKTRKLIEGETVVFEKSDIERTGGASSDKFKLSDKNGNVIKDYNVDTYRIPSEALKRGENSFILTIKNGEGIVENPKETEIELNYSVLQKPAIKNESLTWKTYAGNSHEFDIEDLIEGGDEEGWNNFEPPTLTAEKIETYKSYTQNVNVTFTCEGTVRLNKIITCTLMAWPQANASINERITGTIETQEGSKPGEVISPEKPFEKDREKTYNVLKGDNIVLKTKSEGGHTIWDYEFSVDGVKKTTSKEYTLNDLTVGEHTVTLKAINGKGEIDSEPYEETISLKYKVQPKVTFTPNSISQYELYDGQTINIVAPTYSGGGDGQWETNWENCDKGTFTAKNSTGSNIPDVVTFYTTYELEGVKRLDKHQDFKINMWPVPSADIKENITYIDPNKEEKNTYASEIKVDTLLSDSTNNYIYKLLAGDKVSINVIPNGGTDNWDTTVTINGEKRSNNEFTAEAGKTYDIEVEVKNGEGKIFNNKNLSAKYKRKYQAYAMPELTEKKIKFDIYDGQTTLDLKHEGGYDDVDDNNGWVFNWKEDIPTNISQMQTVTRKCDVLFLNEGLQRVYEPDKEYTINIWPQPSARLNEKVYAKNTLGEEVKLPVSDYDIAYNEKDPQKDDYHIILGEPVIINLSGAQGVDGNWDYTVYDNDKILPPKSDGKGTYEIANLGIGEHTIRMEVVNGEGKVNIPWKKTATRKYIVHPAPELGNTEKETAKVYEGESHDFNIPEVNINEDGASNHIKWEFEWQDGSKENSFTAKQTGEFCNKVKFICEGTERFSAQKNYELKTYTKPEVTINETISAYDFNNKTYFETINQDKLSAETNYEKPNAIDNARAEIVVGDKVSLSVTPKYGEEDNWNTETISYIDSEGNEHPVTDNVFAPNVKGDYIIKVIGKNGENSVDKPYEYSSERKYVVYDKPELTNKPETVHMFNGQTYTFKAGEETGGHIDGWNYSWEAEGLAENVSVERREDKRFTAPEEGVMKTYNPTYTASYSLGGHTRYTNQQVHKMVVYPEPKISALKVSLGKNDNNSTETELPIYYDITKSTGNDIMVECYEGDNIKIDLGIEGGFANTSNNTWSYQKNSESKEFFITDAYETKVIGEHHPTHIAKTVGDKTFDSETLTFTVENVVPDGLLTPDKWWFTDTYTVTVKRWHKPTITPALTDSTSSRTWEASTALKPIDVYAGGYSQNKVNFNINHSFGSPNWKYVWKENGVEKSSELNTWTYIPSSSTGSTDVHVSSSISNYIQTNLGGKIYKNYGCNTTKNYYMKVWKKCRFGNGFVMTDKNQDRTMSDEYQCIRSGNDLKIHADAVEYGYRGSANSIRYDWEGSDISGYSQELNEWSVVMNATDKPDVKGTSEKKIMARVRNYGPYGHVWDGTTQTSQTFKIFNRPSTPTSLVMKGNGTSHTMICTSSVSDTDLQGREYYIVFGYQESDGKYKFFDPIKQELPGTIRWSRQYTNISQMQKAVVYAMWKYPEDKVTVTSGLRTTSTTIDAWDGSNYMEYSGTRGSIDEDLVDDIREILFDEDTSETGRMYTLDGRLITSKMVITPGMYLKEYKEGGKTVVRKVLIN